jgi:hypothetical protein
LTNKKNIKIEVVGFQPKDENIIAINQKMGELTVLLSQSKIDSETARDLHKRFQQAIKDNSLNDGDDEFSIMLSSPQNKKRLKQYLQSESISKFVLIALSIIMIVLGLGMIIMPAPPFFEMFTIFYFNHNDGITIMDLISLIIILAGVYFLIKGIYKNPSLKKLTRNNRYN